MKLFNLFYLSIFALISCNNKNLPMTIGDPKNAVNYGYQPIDPLPTKLLLRTPKEGTIPIVKGTVKNNQIMGSLPDETMRLAIGEINLDGNVSFTSAKVGYKNHSYIVVLDYIKFNTVSLPLDVSRDSSRNILDFKIKKSTGPEDQVDVIIPMYIGVGLRFTATITVNEGKVDLGNLFALGLAAEAKKVTGTLIIQTLGISGNDISSLIPMPSQINTTTIQNAIMSLAAIKAKIYDDKVEINPRVVGFYNNIGGGQSTVHKFITGVLSNEVNLIVE